MESTLFGDMLNKKSACEDSVRLVKSLVGGGSGAAMRNGSEFGLSIDVGHQRGMMRLRKAENKELRYIDLVVIESVNCSCVLRDDLIRVP